jgi:hypothetical protein
MSAEDPGTERGAAAGRAGRFGDLTRRSFVGGLVVLAGCGDIASRLPTGDGGDGGTPTGTPTPSPTPPPPTPDPDDGDDTYLTVVDATFVPGRTFPNDDRTAERGYLDVRVRNDADRRMREVALMPSFYDASGQPTNLGTATVWNLDPGETWHGTVPVRGLGTAVVASRVAGTFLVDPPLTGIDDAGTAGDGSGGSGGTAGGSGSGPLGPLEVVAGSGSLAVDDCDATVSGRLRNTGGDLRYAGVLAKLHAGDELLGNAVAHRAGIGAAAEWSFTVGVPLADLAATPDGHTLEPTGPWGALGY